MRALPTIIVSENGTIVAIEEKRVEYTIMYEVKNVHL